MFFYIILALIVLLILFCVFFMQTKLHVYVNGWDWLAEIKLVLFGRFEYRVLGFYLVNHKKKSYTFNKLKKQSKSKKKAASSKKKPKVFLWILKLAAIKNPQLFVRIGCTDAVTTALVSGMITAAAYSAFAALSAAPQISIQTNFYNPCFIFEFTCIIHLKLTHIKHTIQETKEQIDGKTSD